MGAFEGPDLDPTDWEAVRRESHRMLDGVLDHIRTLREQPVWRAPPAEARAAFREPLPAEGDELSAVYERFAREVLPYASGNAHPGFMGWVQGGGSVPGVLGEMLAAGMNANLGGRDHMPLEVEQQVIAWVRELFGFPAQAGGLFLTGTSQAVFLALLMARTRELGPDVRRAGLGEAGLRLTAYASAGAHGCVAQAMELAGLGSDQLRRVATDTAGRMRLDALRAGLAEDRARGLRPFLLVGTAGTVDTGAIDDLDALAELAAREALFFLVDGAVGALGMLSPEIAPRLKGIERADAIGFDWHKWGQAPYDAGFLLVRDAELQRGTFASEAAYLRRLNRGLAGGEWWPSDFGPDLSRSFRALKTWFTVKTFGGRALGRVMARCCELARTLAQRVEAEPQLELLAPVALNIVCFRARGPDADALNSEIVARLHEGGHPAPSLTTIGGRTAIRAAIVNHRTRREDVEALVEQVLRIAGDLAAERGG